ncbi:hypothetical protein AHAS_Ahas01G0142200 [Arachis hypogaea]
MTKTLLRKRWLFPDEMVVAICSNNESLISTGRFILFRYSRSRSTEFSLVT